MSNQVWSWLEPTFLILALLGAVWAGYIALRSAPPDKKLENRVKLAVALILLAGGVTGRVVGHIRYKSEQEAQAKARQEQRERARIEEEEKVRRRYPLDGAHISIEAEIKLDVPQFAPSLARLDALSRGGLRPDMPALNVPLVGDGGALEPLPDACLRDMLNDLVLDVTVQRAESPAVNAGAMTRSASGAGGADLRFELRIGHRFKAGTAFLYRPATHVIEIAAPRIETNWGMPNGSGAIYSVPQLGGAALRVSLGGMTTSCAPAMLSAAVRFRAVRLSGFPRMNDAVIPLEQLAAPQSGRPVFTASLPLEMVK